MPEAEDSRAGALAVDSGVDALFGDHFKAPGAADNRQQRPHQARNHGQHKALAEGESGVWLRLVTVFDSRHCVSWTRL